jgi:hypothetical protein
MVPEAGLEPAHPKAGDFESPASTNFATLANQYRSVAAYITQEKISVNNFFKYFLNLA